MQRVSGAVNEAKRKRFFVYYNILHELLAVFEWLAVHFFFVMRNYARHSGITGGAEKWHIFLL